MNEPPDHEPKLASELKRRKVVRVLVAYGLVSLAVIEAADNIFPRLLLPDWTVTTVIVVVLIGFPVAVLLSWFYQITPDGVRREVTGAIPSAGSKTWIGRGAIPLILVAVVLLVWRPWRGTDPLAAFASAEFTDSVAVLPIANRTGEPDNDRFTAGIGEDIVRRLQALGGVKVINPYSVQSLLDMGLTDGQLRDSLGVEKLLRASLYAEAGRFWLNVLATVGSDGGAGWTERYDAAGADFAAAGQLVAAVTDDYVRRSPLAAQSYGSAVDRATGHVAVIEGNEWLARRTHEGISRARELYESAIEADPEDASAHAALSRAHALSLAYRYEMGLTGYESAGLALFHANRAVELDPDLAAGYAARGLIASRSSAPASTVASDCRRALDLEPSAADGLSWCGRVLRQLGYVDRAILSSERAIQLDPRNAGRRQALAYDALSVGRLDEAVDQASKASALAPSLVQPRVLQARALLLSDRPAACLGLDLGPYAGTRATCLHQLGRVDEARVIADSLVDELSRGRIRDSIYATVSRAEDLAIFYAWTGNPELARDWVERAFDLSPSGVEPRTLESSLFDLARRSGDFGRSVNDIQASIWPRVVEAAERVAAAS